MIKVIIPLEPNFIKYKYELKILYETHQEKICDPNNFDFIVNNTLFYLFTTVSDELIGALYYFKDGNKLYFNGFGKRGYLTEKIECLKTSLDWFNCDIYAEAQNRASAFCLLRAGFKRVKDKLFVCKKQKKKGKSYDI